MDNKKLAIALAVIEDEKDIRRLLKNEGYWNDMSCWKNYGDNENNFSIVGNQQNSPDTSLREQIINAVDAFLMRTALEKGINPTGKDAQVPFEKHWLSFLTYMMEGYTISHLQNG